MKILRTMDGLFFRKKSTHNIQIDSFDGLRGLAVLFVLFSHTSNAGVVAAGPLNFSGSGKYGVYLFFVLSSFLLSMPLLKKESLLGGRLWLNYSVRRFFRVFPLFACALFANFIASSLLLYDFPIALTLGDVKGHLLLQEGRDIFWTIPVEVKYYLILPVVVFILSRVLRKGLAVGGAFVVLLILLLNVLWPVSSFELNTVMVTPYLPIFLLGSFSALVYLRLTAADTAISRGQRLAFELMAAAALLAVAVTIPSVWRQLTGQQIGNDHFHRSFVLFGVLWTVFIVCYTSGTGFLSRALSFKPLRFIGIISFSVYLWHMPVVRAVSAFPGGRGAVGLLSIFLITLAISSMSYLLVERPFSRVMFR